MPVSIKYTSDDADVIRGLQRQAAAQDKLIKKLRETKGEAANVHKEQQKMAREGKRLTEQMSTPLERHNQRLRRMKTLLKEGAISQRTFNRAVAQGNAQMRSGFGARTLAGLQGTAAGFISIAAAIGVVNAALERKKKLESGALDERTVLSNARAQVTRNLIGGGVGSEQRAKFYDTIRNISTTTGAPESQLTDAFAQAISAQGGDKPAVALEAVRQAARLMPDRPGDIAQLAGGLLDLSDLTGTDDARANAAYLAQVGKRSRIVEQQFQTTNVVPALAGLRSFGAGQQGAGNLMAALSVGSADVRGAVSGTTALGLAKQMREFEPTAGLESMTERIRFLQNDRNAALEFLESASFEKKGLGAVESLLLDPASKTARAFSQGGYATGPAAVQQFEQTVAEIGAVRGIVGAGERITAVAAGEAARDPQLQRAATARNALERFSEISKASWFGDKSLGMEYNVSTMMGFDEIDTVTTMIEKRLRFNIGGLPLAADQASALEQMLTELRGIQNNQNAGEPVTISE